MILAAPTLSSSSQCPKLVDGEQESTAMPAFTQRNMFDVLDSGDTVEIEYEEEEE